MSDRRQDLLRQRFEHGTAARQAGASLAVLALVAFLWPVSPHGPLLWWAGSKLVVSAGLMTFRRVDLEFAPWFRAELGFQFFEGLTWGLLAVVAMPVDPVYQSLLAGTLSCVAVASSTGESQFIRLHFGFLFPMAGGVLFAYLVSPGGNGASTVVFICATLYAFGASVDDRSIQWRIADMTMENERLVARTETERDALEVANGKLDRLAWTDALTGLANRAAGMARMRETLNPGGLKSGELTVAYIDLDGFKQVNDQYGHAAGDKVLIHAADRLRAAATPDELVCRLGGDELIVLSAGNVIHDLGERVAQAFDSPMTIEGRVLAVTAGIGMAALSSPGEPEELLRRADQALYHHKRASDRQRWVAWSESDQPPESEAPPKPAPQQPEPQSEALA